MRRRDEDDHPSSIKHILHTFRPEERLGELRLGLEEPSPPPEQLSWDGDPRETSTRSSGDPHGDDGDGSRHGVASSIRSGDTMTSTPAAGEAGRRYGEREGPRGRENGNSSAAKEEQEERVKAADVANDSGRGLENRRRLEAETGGGDGEVIARQPQASMWRSRWIYRDRRSPAMEPDELQVEVRTRTRTCLTNFTDPGCCVHSRIVSLSVGARTGTLLASPLLETALELLAGAKEERGGNTSSRVGKAKKLTMPDMYPKCEGMHIEQ